MKPESLFFLQLYIVKCILFMCVKRTQYLSVNYQVV